MEETTKLIFCLVYNGHKTRSFFFTDLLVVVDIDKYFWTIFLNFIDKMTILNRIVHFSRLFSLPPDSP